MRTKRLILIAFLISVFFAAMAAWTIGDIIAFSNKIEIYTNGTSGLIKVKASTDPTFAVFYGGLSFTSPVTVPSNPGTSLQTGTKYYVQVTSGGITINDTICTIPNIPAISILSKTCNSVIAEWDSVTTENEYEYKLYRTPAWHDDQNDTLISEGRVYDNEIELSDLRSNWRYHLYVKAWCRTSFSEFNNITFKTDTIERVHNLTNSQITTSDFVASWSSSECAKSYRLQISRDNNWNNNNNCPKKPSDGTDTTIVVYNTSYNFGSAFWSYSCEEDLQNGHTYYWRVRACNGTCSDWMQQSITIPLGNGRSIDGENKESTFNIQVFPNPVSSVINFCSDEWGNFDFSGTELTIYDQSGKPVMRTFTDFKHPVNVENLPVGIYTLLYSVNNVSYQNRIIKNEF